VSIYFFMDSGQLVMLDMSKLSCVAVSQTAY